MAPHYRIDGVQVVGHDLLQTVFDNRGNDIDRRTVGTDYDS